MTENGAYVTCAHRFLRVAGAWRTTKNERYRCVLCGFLTRHYDSIDGQAGRPVHPHMSVAYKGVNTVDRKHANGDYPAGDELPVTDTDSDEGPICGLCGTQRPEPGHTACRNCA